MQDFRDINVHAIVERNTPAIGMQLVAANTVKAGRNLARKLVNVAPKRILLVDDYPDALEIWGLYLRSMGYEVLEAEDGLTAVARANQYHPDIIILDLELPGITGFEAAVRLRASADTRDIPLIAATGYSHVQQLSQARASGFDAIVVKPCEPAALVAEVERLLQPSREPTSAAMKRFSQNR
jgi:CheY-like chemotaxis protein